LADSKAIELHEFRFVQFDCDPCPKGVEIVGFPARRHGNRHDRAHLQIEGTGNRIHRGADRMCFCLSGCRDVLRRRPYCRGTQFIYVWQRQKNGWGPPCELRGGPRANVIKHLAIWAASRLRRRGDPHYEVGTLGLRSQVRRRSCAVIEPRHVNDRHGWMPFRFEKVFLGI
jgi:hypothetical protein